MLFRSQETTSKIDKHLEKEKQKEKEREEKAKEREEKKGQTTEPATDESGWINKWY